MFQNQEEKSEYAIQDIGVSDSQEIIKTNSQKLCTSFESLWKNNQKEQLTLSTAWNSQSIYHEHSIDIEPNQNLSFQILNGEIFLKKKQIIENRSSLMTRMSGLLPYYCTTKLPQQLFRMLKIVEKLDAFLIQKKKQKYTQNILNLIRKLFPKEEESSILSEIKKVLFLVPDLYQFYQDPHKSLALGFVAQKRVKLQHRKSKVRKLLVDYYLQKCHQGQPLDLCEVLVHPSKISKFYPENLSLIKEFKESEINKQKQFLDNLKTSVLIKQKQLREWQDAQQANAHQHIFIEDIEDFCNDIELIYQQKGVSNMFKVSLVENLRRTYKYGLGQILSSVQRIVEGGIFLSRQKGNEYQNIRIFKEQKQKLAQIWGMQDMVRNQ